jgi:poly(hydroxyalkanoate) depolymerase family esterase
MTDAKHPDLLEATRLSRAGRLSEAMTLLQRALQGKAADAAPAGSTATAARADPYLRNPGDDGQPPPRERAGSTASAIPKALRGFIERVRNKGLGSVLEGLVEPRPEVPTEPLPEGARFIEGSYRNAAGSRTFKLFVPSGCRGKPVPLLVMLHGCTQSPDDFAAGTRMNRLAEEHTCLVVYPAQAPSANHSRCWNWFEPGHQERERGEPSLIAGITRQVMRDYPVDAGRVYVAGLSAGGAAAAVMAATYPDLYAAFGVHSGLAHGAASDVPSAFAAMKHGAERGDRPQPQLGSAGSPRLVPAIVFHGDQDETVNPVNGEQLMAQLRAAADGVLQPTATVQHGRVPGGRAYRRTIHADRGGRALLEHWEVQGGGHAWSGGSTLGTYADPLGPDASREMLRFFLQHTR